MGGIGALVGVGTALTGLAGVVNTAFGLHLALRVSGARVPLPAEFLPVFRERARERGTELDAVDARSPRQPGDRARPGKGASARRAISLTP